MNKIKQNIINKMSIFLSLDFVVGIIEIPGANEEVLLLASLQFNFLGQVLSPESELLLEEVKRAFISIDIEKSI